MSTPGPPENAWPDDQGAFEELLLLALRRILADEDPVRFLRWARDTLAPLLQRAEPDLGPGEDRRLAFLLARAIWDATPLPGQGYRTRPLHAPDAAMPCPCGLGLIYGACCGLVQDAPEIPQDFMWELLLAELDETRFRQALVAEALPRHLLGRAAERWLLADRPGRAIALLEPLFAEGTVDHLDGRFEPALNSLCDAYDRRDHWKKKRSLLNRMRAHPCRDLRAAAWQRLCAIHIDEGAFTEAQLAFVQAQREAPDQPGMALLEVALLATQHEDRLARERALFWRHKLMREGRADPGILDFLAEAQRDLEEALVASQADLMDPRLLDLRDWLRLGSRRPLPTYTLVPGGPETEAAAADGALALQPSPTLPTPGPAPGLADSQATDVAGHPYPAPNPDDRRQLQPPPAVLALEQRWQRLFPVATPSDTWLTPPPEAPGPWEEASAAGWLDWLDRHPEAADSLEVLADLAGAIYTHPDSALPRVGNALLAPLLERAQTLIEGTLPATGTETLPWDLPDNRPALRLLFHRFLLKTDQGQEEEARASLEALLRLNPWDHHGLRAELMNRYLRQGENQAALALARRFPDDRLADLAYGEVLAWYRQGAARQAKQALRRALTRLPLVLRYLTRKRVARPPHRERKPHPAGAETAWFYRESMGDVWAAEPGLLDWLRRQAS